MSESRFNSAAGYRHRDFDLGFSPDRIPLRPAFAVLKGEEVVMTGLRYNGIPVEKLERDYDETDFAIVEEIGRSRYLSSLQIYQFVSLRGCSVSRQGIRQRLNRMLKYRVIREYALTAPETGGSLKVYDLDFKGCRIAQDRGVVFHKGNAYIKGLRLREQGMMDSPEDIKRILAGNMIVLGNLMNGASCKRFGIMETMRPSQTLEITDGCIIRTAANMLLDDESLLLYEVVRNVPGALSALEDKLKRYYTLVNDSRYLESNYYGYRALPQLVICGESSEHCLMIDRHLRERGLIREEDSLLYTEDLFYVQGTLQNLYELDEKGERTWYCLPALQEDGDLKTSA